MSLTSIHNDYLDPDKWLYNNCNDEGEEEHTLTASQKKEIKKLHTQFEKAMSKAYDPKNRKSITFESLFGDIEGDFSWGGEPEDVGNAWNCGDKDCESQWHNSIQVVEMGRKAGKTWYIVLEDSCAGDGDYQPCAGWDEREGDVITKGLLDDLWFHHEGRMIDHFYGWGMYCLDCAVTGKDPLNNWRFSKSMTPDEAIKAAKSNLKYLRMN
jgi:hypothetical protein